MERNSALNVTVNTTNGAARLRSFTALLRDAERQGVSLNQALSQLGKVSGLNTLTASFTRVNTGLQSNTQFLGRATTAMDANVAAANRAQIAQNKLTTSTLQAGTAATRASAATTAAANANAIAQQRLAAITSQASAAQTKAAAAAVAAASQAAIGQQRLAAATAAASAAQTKAAAASTTASNNAAIGQQRLAAASSQASTAASRAAASHTKAIAAVTAASNDAALGQQKLAQATHNTAAAMSRSAQAATRAGAAIADAANQAAMAQQKLLAATANAAAAQTRAAAAVTTAANNQAIGQQKLAASTAQAAAAASRAAAAAAGVTTAQNNAAASAVRLAAAEAKAAADLARLGNAGSVANGQMRGFMATMNHLQGVLQGGLLAFSGLSFLRTADEMQSLNSQIRLVTKSEEEFLGVREQVRRVADKNYNDVASTTNLYQKSARALANLGKSQADAIKFTDAVSLAMRTGGRSALEQASAIYQLSQSMGAGVLNGDEFRTITETAPLLLDMVAERMGVLTGDLKELSGEGKITSAIIYDAMVDNVALLEEMAKKMPLTMGQSLMVFKNQYKTFTDEIMNKQGGLSSIIAGSLTNMADNFDNIAKVAVAGLGLAFLQVASMINVSTLAMKAFNLVVKANPLVLMVSSVMLVASAFYGLEDVLGTTGIMFGDLFGSIKLGLGSLSDLAWAVGYDISTAMGTSAADSQESFEGFFSNTETGFAGLMQGVGRTMAAATSTLAALFQSLGAGVRNLILDIRNKFTEFGDFVSRVFSGVVNEIIGNVNGAISFIDGLTTRANSALDFFNSPLNFKMIGQIEYKSTPRAPSPLIPIDRKTMGERIDGNISTLMPMIDGYFGKLAKEQAAAIAPKVPYVLSTDEMKKGSLAVYQAREEEKRREEAKEQAKRDAKGQEAVELVRKAVLGGKDWGISKGGSFGGARGHNGLDIPTPVGTQVYAPESGTIKAYGSDRSRGGKQMILIADSGKKYGFAHLNSFDVADGTQVPAGMGIAKSGATGSRSGGKRYGQKGDGYADHLHLTITNERGVKINPANATVGKSKYDDTIGSYNDKVAAAAAKAAEEAQREQERRQAVQLKLLKEYGTQEQKLMAEHRERVDEIAGSGLSADEQLRLIGISDERRKNDLAKYQDDLAKKVSSLSDHLRTERDMIEQARTDAQNNLTYDAELSRPENAELLKQAREAVDAKYNYDINIYEATLERQERDLYAFKRTERQVLIDGWDDKLADAARATDELREIRLKAVTEEREQSIKSFDLQQQYMMLELNEKNMSEIGFIRAKYALEAELNEQSNNTPEYKALNGFNLRTAASAAAEESQNRVRGTYAGQTAQLLGQRDPNTEVTSQWKADHIVAAEAFEEGIIGLEEYHQRMLDLDEDYMNKKQAIIVGGYQTVYSTALSLLSGFGLENSRIYKGLYAVEKGYALNKAWLNSKTAIMDAYTNTAGGVPAKLMAAAEAASTTGFMTAAIEALDFKGYQKGGYTGLGGDSDVAGLVHKQEYVFDAPATRRIGTDKLDKIRSGEDTGDDGGNVFNIYVTVDASGNANMSGDVGAILGRKVADGMKQAARDVIRQEKLQGGLLHG